MFQKALSFLLVFSWIVLSGFDVTEDLELPNPSSFENSTDDDLTGNRPAGLLARNIIETATDEGSRCSSLLQACPAPSGIGTPRFSQRASKLHKVYRVFLI
jgi:hypothetical protein